MPNNWKLYFENVKDTYHASILHLFLTTFRINRLTMPGGIYINQDGGNHYSFAKLDYAAEDAEYKDAEPAFGQRVPAAGQLRGRVGG